MVRRVDSDRFSWVGLQPDARVAGFAMATMASPRRASANATFAPQILISRPAQNGARNSRFSVFPAALRGNSSISTTSATRW
jgi:hypothetical protein